jgi:hypothetical protein
MRITTIDRLLEHVIANTAIGIEEAFISLPHFAIFLDDALDGINRAILVKARPGDLADRDILRTRPAERELVIFDAFLVDAEDADMPGMVMPAGVDAAGDLELEFANVALAVQIGKAL